MCSSYQKAVVYFSDLLEQAFEQQLCRPLSMELIIFRGLADVQDSPALALNMPTYTAHYVHQTFLPFGFCMRFYSQNTVSVTKEKWG